VDDGWLGTRLNHAATGVAAAALLATSPAFLLQLTQPVSDVPAAAWWTASLALVISPGSLAALAAGLAAAMAVLTRPNLVPLAALLAAYLVWDVWRPTRGTRRQPAARLLLFASADTRCLAVAAINNTLSVHLCDRDTDHSGG
jgi:4-amino-4-deoxy-L-arabinose transferase-like glycosyltransferase